MWGIWPVSLGNKSAIPRAAPFSLWKWSISYWSLWRCIRLVRKDMKALLKWFNIQVIQYWEAHWWQIHTVCWPVLSGAEGSHNGKGPRLRKRSGRRLEDMRSSSGPCRVGLYGIILTWKGRDISCLSISKHLNIRTVLPLFSYPGPCRCSWQPAVENPYHWPWPPPIRPYSANCRTSRPTGHRLGWSSSPC